MAKILLATALMGVALARPQCEKITFANTPQVNADFAAARAGKPYTVVANLQAY